MKLPLLPIYIDYFRNPYGLSDAGYLISHFHSDHMKGLSSSWNAGTIICDKVTKELLIQKYGTNLSRYLKSLPLFEPIPLLRTTTTTIFPYDNVEESENKGENVINNNANNLSNSNTDEEVIILYLLPAFHIPGSVMFFFETPFGNILYTGDFKYDDIARSVLNPFFAKHKVDHIYVDDTWLHLGIRETSLVPYKNKTGTQILCKLLSENELQEAIEAVGRRMDARVRDFKKNEKETRETNKGPYVLRVCLHNQFGKEHLLQRLAARLGTKVIVDDARYERLRLLEKFNKEIGEFDTRFCINLNFFEPFGNSNIFPRIEVVPSLKYITPEELRDAAIMNNDTPHYGIVMSGWARLQERNNNNNNDDTSIIWQIPTTQHCKPQDIIDFIAMLRPMSITPLHFKPCRGEVIMQRLGSYLRRPYFNQFLTASDHIQYNMKDWKLCLIMSPEDNVESLIKPNKKKHGICINVPLTLSSPKNLGSDSAPKKRLRFEIEEEVKEKEVNKPNDNSSSRNNCNIYLNKSPNALSLSQLADLLGL